MPVVTASEWGVDGGAKVRLEDDSVTVTWTCGDTRTFTREHLEYTVELLQYAIRHDSWFTHEDSDGDSFACLVRGGRFYAAGAAGNDSAQSIDWQDFAEALDAALGREEPAAEPIAVAVAEEDGMAVPSSAPGWVRRVLPANWFTT